MKNTEDNTVNLNSILLKSNSLETYFMSVSDVLADETFGTFVARLAVEKDVSIPTLCRRSGINESYCYQVIKGTRNPGRDKTIQIAFGLSLSIGEANKLLRANGKNELYCRKKRDAIIIFALNNNHSFEEVNELLHTHSEACLGNE